MKVNKNSIAIVGWHEGSAGQIHAWFEKWTNYRVACFIHPNDRKLNIDPSTIQRDTTQFSYPTSDSFKSLPLIYSSDWTSKLKRMGIGRVLVTTPDQKERFQQINRSREEGFTLINAIHPSALIMEDALLSDNVILYPRAFVGYRAEVFSGEIINVGSQIDHHNVVGECATVAPGVTCAGNVTIGRFATVHTGAVIKKTELG